MSATSTSLDTAAASHAAGTGAPSRRLGLALADIATAQLMVVLDRMNLRVREPSV